MGYHTRRVALFVILGNTIRGAVVKVVIGNYIHKVIVSEES